MNNPFKDLEEPTWIDWLCCAIVLIILMVAR